MNRGKCVCDCHFHDLMAVLREPFSDKSPHIITFTKKGFPCELCPHFLFWLSNVFPTKTFQRKSVLNEARAEKENNRTWTKNRIRIHFSIFSSAVFLYCNFTHTTSRSFHICRHFATLQRYKLCLFTSEIVATWEPRDCCKLYPSLVALVNKISFASCLEKNLSPMIYATHSERHVLVLIAEITLNKLKKKKSARLFCNAVSIIRSSTKVEMLHGERCGVFK